MYGSSGGGGITADASGGSNKPDVAQQMKTQSHAITEYLMAMQDPYIIEKHLKFKKTERKVEGESFLQRYERDYEHRTVFKKISENVGEQIKK